MDRLINGFECESISTGGRYESGTVTIDEVPYEMSVQIIDGFAVIEGDIIVGTESEFLSAQSNAKGLIITPSGGKRWPDGIMNYMIEADFPDADRINEAIEHWEERTFIRFDEVNDENLNHVLFRRVEQGCSANVGMQGNGRQNINLSDACPVGTVIHEIGHSLGLWHEHTRGDRDTYVQVFEDNIEPDELHNFQIHRTDGIMKGAYDYRSIMHYPRTAFGRVVDGVRQVTIEVLDINRPPIGQRARLSNGDIAAINTSYFPDRQPPCTSSVCNPADIIELPDIRDVLMNEPYRSDIFVGSNYSTDLQIIKVRNMSVSENPGVILFELDEDPLIHHPYKAIIIENLNIPRINPADHDLRFILDRSNQWNVVRGLDAEDQTEVPPDNIGHGANGFDGYQGHKGKTKNSPAVFLFIKNIHITEGDISELSFAFEFPGIPGGSGGKGGVGGNGNKGKRGRSARNGDFGSCRRGNGFGHQGGSPGRGGKGGDAGCSGDGSNIFVFFEDPEMYEVMDRSHFFLDGFSDLTNEFAGGGKPGDAGRDGPGGDSGRTAGNCTPRTRPGRNGTPEVDSEEWLNWNLGPGNDAVPGKDGVFNDELLDDISRLVFSDPFPS